jgi:hypothetical protein
MIVTIIEATENWTCLPYSGRDKWHYCDSNIDKAMNCCCYHWVESSPGWTNSHITGFLCSELQMN